MGGGRSGGARSEFRRSARGGIQCIVEMRAAGTPTISMAGSALQHTAAQQQV